MSTTNHYLIKQVWRQKGDEPFARIPFKEANKAEELSQTTRPVLLLETKSNGGSGAVFAIGRVTEPIVIEEAVEYANGEHLYHVPFTYDFALENKKDGLSREELQELAGQKFAPQVRGGLYEIEESVFEQVKALLEQRAGGAAGAQTELKPTAKEAVAPAKEAKTAKSETKATKEQAKSVASSAAGQNDALADALQAAHAALLERPELLAVSDNGTFSLYPAVLLAAETDLVALQEIVAGYVAQGGQADIDAAAQEAAAAGASDARFAKVIGLASRLVREGKYDAVQIPTMQKAFYRGGHLPHPYQAIELQGTQGHHVLGADGTLYTVEGKTVQHFLGL